MTEVILIVAVGPNNVIGQADKLIWHSKQDFYHFKKQTKGYPCIFGDKTFFGLPKYPLKNRQNIVVSLDYTDSAETMLCSEFDISKDPVEHKHTGSYQKINSIKYAIQIGSNFDKVFICGGASIYKYALENNLVDTIYLTKIDSPTLQKEVDEDIDKKKYIYFPIDLDEFLKKDWKKENIEYDISELPEENDDLVIQFQKWTKK